ncbi:hypothetical protein K438DRAFT_1765915 [Mycena galopus ATCC 62051]|nr:hypothetical protein K438DRAFT_1765915 [Mycena galopus ATCC 62051]
MWLATAWFRTRVIQVTILDRRVPAAPRGRGEIFLPPLRENVLPRRPLPRYDMSAIHPMLDIIESQIEDYDVTMERVRSQFELEYGIKLRTSPHAFQAAALDFERPTTQERNEELLYDEQRQESVPFPEQDLREVIRSQSMSRNSSVPFIPVLYSQFERIS